LETAHRPMAVDHIGDPIVPEPTINPRPRQQIMVYPLGDVEPPPSSTEDDEEAVDVPSEATTHAPNAHTEDIGSVQFSSICSPFLTTSDVPMQPGRPHPPDPPPLVYPWRIRHQGQIARSTESTRPAGIRSPCLRRPRPPIHPTFFAHLAIDPPEHSDCLRTGRSANPHRGTSCIPPRARSLPHVRRARSGPLLTLTTPPRPSLTSSSTRVPRNFKVL
jgi:hypothetical protein